METAYNTKDLTHSLALYKQRHYTEFMLSERQFCNENGEWNMFMKELKCISYSMLQSDRSLFKDTVFWVWRRPFGVAKCSSTLKMAATDIDRPDYTTSHFTRYKSSYCPTRELKSVKEFFLLGANIYLSVLAANGSILPALDDSVVSSNDVMMIVWGTTTGRTPALTSHSVPQTPHGTHSDWTRASAVWSLPLPTWLVARF
jgi:hypothetical protein